MSFQCKYSDAAHRYTFHENGKSWQVPSVTQALESISKSGLAWANPIALELAASRGTAVHFAINAWLDNEGFPLEFGGYVAAFRRWACAVNFKPMYREKVVYSRRYGFAGRVDLLGYVNGSLSIIDIKTGIIPKWVNLQLSAYTQACNESVKEFRVAWMNRYALRLESNGNHKMAAFAHQDLDFFNFLTHLKSTLEKPQWKSPQQNQPQSSTSTSRPQPRSKSRRISKSPVTSSTKRPASAPKK